MKRILVVVAVLVLAAGIVQARRWVGFETGQLEQAPEFRVLSSNSFRTVVELELAGMYVDEVRANGQTWQTIELGMAAGGLLTEQGSPQLPVVARFLKIPDDRAVEVRVLELDEVVLEGYSVYPAQPPLREDQTLVPFVINEKRYRTDEFYPGVSFRTSDPMIMRDFRLVQLVLQPARFNPVSGELRMARKLRVQLTHNGLGRINVKHRNRFGISRAFEPLYKKLIANYDFGPPQRPEDGSYLIITHDNFASAVEPFAEWKTRKGWRTVVKTTSEIGGSDSATIRAYIADAYNNWPYPPDYVLLVGDAPGYLQCYHKSGNTHASDLPYSTHEGGDILADLMVGRVCVQTLTEARAAMNKLYRYEKEPYMANTDWFGKACAIAAYEGGPRFWTVVIRIRNYVMGRPFTQFDTLFQRWSLNTKQGLMDSLALGRSWMLYRGHGSVTGWGNVSPTFSVSDVYNLQNGRMTPIVIGPTCLAGDFDNSSECLAEAWTKAGSPDSARGGTGYFGSSEVSYSGYNDSLAAGAFFAYTDSLLYTYAQCTQWGKLFMLMAYPLPDPTSEKEIWMFNSLGEPEENIWSATPRILTVTHPATVFIGSFPFEVTVNASDDFAPVENALVCVMSRTDTSVYHVGYTNPAGRIQFTLNTTQPGDSILVTVTGRNLHPYMGLALVISPNTAYVTYLSHIVNDSPPGGNADGIINPGETIKLGIWVKNWGSAVADSVYGTLRIDDANVTMLDSVNYFGTVEAGDSAFNASGFRFSVASACTNGYVLGFELECRDANDSLWYSSLNLWVGTPVLGYDEYIVNDPPPGGNGDGKIDPGETAQLILVLRNTGLGHGYDVAGILRSGDSRFQVSDSAGEFGDIMKDTTGNNSADPFVVHADASIPIETPIPCTLLVSAEGYSGTVLFTVVVGEVRAIDPIPDGPRRPALYWAYDHSDTGYVEHPEFAWVEINSIGTRLDFPQNDDVLVVNLPSGFGPFKCYGQRYTQVSVSADGWIVPGNYTSTNFTNTSLPSSSAPPRVIALNWDDLYPGYGGSGYVYYYHDAANGWFIIEYDSVPYYDRRSIRDKCEIVISDTTVTTPSGDNVFVCQYLTANGYTSNTIGIQDPTKTIGIQCLCNGDYHQGCPTITGGRAIKYTTAEPLTGIVDETVGPAGIGRAGFAVWPNPVRSWAQVRFGLKRESEVKLAVFDRAGRQVRGLRDTRLETGDYLGTWDGRDDFGRGLAQGVYFLRLEAGAERLVKKAVVLE